MWCDRGLPVTDVDLLYVFSLLRARSLAALYTVSRFSNDSSATADGTNVRSLHCCYGSHRPFAEEDGHPRGTGRKAKRKSELMGCPLQGFVTTVADPAGGFSMHFNLPDDSVPHPVHNDVTVQVLEERQDILASDIPFFARTIDIEFLVQQVCSLRCHCTCRMCTLNP